MQTASKIRNSRTAKGALALAAGLMLTVFAASAQVSLMATSRWAELLSDHLPSVLDKVAIVQRLNKPIPLDGEFRDETGKAIHLGDYFGQRPAILALVYYNCPMLCSEELDGLVGALEMVKFKPGKDFNLIVVSIDPSETLEIAAKKKAFDQNVMATRKPRMDGTPYRGAACDQGACFRHGFWLCARSRSGRQDDAVRACERH